MRIIVFIILIVTISSCQDDQFQYKEQCVSLCPGGTFPDEYQVCVDCGDFCGTCSGPSDNECITCIKGLYFFKGTCSASCALGSFKNAQNQQCDKCDPICNLCEERQNKCISCFFEKILTEKFECGDKCEENQYIDRSTPIKKCQKCYKTCKTCTGGKADDCETCFLGYNLKNGRCNSTCTPSEYFDPFTQHCLQCHPDCKSCIGDWEDDCIECFPGKKLENGVCSDRCSDDKFYDGESCIVCHTDCVQCFGKKANQCTTCPEGNYLTHQNGCSDTCRDGTYVESGNWKCQMCFKGCIECFGPAENQCVKCYENMNFEDGKCLRLCADKFFFQEGQCIKCHASCETCQEKGPLECTSCFDGFFLNEDQCVSICPFGFYENEEQRLCLACDDACEKCTGPSFKDCILENKIDGVEEFKEKKKVFDIFDQRSFQSPVQVEELRQPQTTSDLNTNNKIGLEDIIVKLKEKMETDISADFKQKSHKNKLKKQKQNK